MLLLMKSNVFQEVFLEKEDVYSKNGGNNYNI
jgi:hypothetical protein